MLVMSQERQSHSRIETVIQNEIKIPEEAYGMHLTLLY